MIKSAKNRIQVKPAPAQEAPEPVQETEKQVGPVVETPPPVALDPDFEPGFTRRIEVRLALPRPQVRYVQGKPVREGGPDPERLILAIQPDLLSLVEERYGAQTELVITTATAPGVRVLSG